MALQLLRRYDFAVVNADTPLKMINAGFWLMTDMWLRITRRTDCPAEKDR